MFRPARRVRLLMLAGVNPRELSAAQQEGNGMAQAFETCAGARIDLDVPTGACARGGR